MPNHKIVVSIAQAAAIFLASSQAMAGYPHFEKHQADSDDDEGSHYSDLGAHPTKAQRLGVTLQARALMNKDGTTDFELTTGKLDSTASAPGRIVRVELSLPETRNEGRERENREWEAEYEHLKGDGYFHAVLPGREHGQTLNVRAKILITRAPTRDRDRDDHGRDRDDHGRDGDDHDGESLEISLQTVVQYRPDLAVTNFEFPLMAQPNTVVVFSATVAELKGDVGEHSDCVLLLDGQKVDDMKGPIWVDAAGLITCRFAYRFAASGTHTVAAALQNGAPGDADLSNNMRSGQIVIQDPARIFYSDSASESKAVRDSAIDSYFTSTSTVPDKHQGWHNTSVQQIRNFVGHFPSAVHMPLARISFTDSSDGVPLSSLALTNVSADFTAPSPYPAFTTESCIQRLDSVTGGWLLLCSYLNANTGVGSTTVHVRWDAGAATYHSDGYCHSVVGGYQCSGGNYTFNTSSANGTLVTFGANYAADVLVDDGTAYQAHPAMALQLQVSDEAPTPLCSDHTFPPSTTVGKMCFSFMTHLETRFGAGSVQH